MNKDQLKEVENTRAQMRKGILDYCVLLVVSHGKIYANDIIVQLKKADLIVVEGTLYPLLSRLMKSELLEYTWEESKNGPPRKYYTLTDKGGETMAELSKTWGRLSKSINAIIKSNKQ